MIDNWSEMWALPQWPIWLLAAAAPDRIRQQPRLQSLHFSNPKASQHRNGGRFKRAQRRTRSSDDTHGEMQQRWRLLAQQLHERLLQLDSLHSAALWRVIYLPLWRDCGRADSYEGRQEGR